MNYAYAKHFRQLEDFTVTNIYKPYRSGGLKVDGKFIPKTFVYQDGKLMEKKWNGSGFDLVEYTEKLDREFYKTYKKVFDITLALPKPVEIETKDGLQTVSEITINALGAYKVKEMLKADFDFNVPMDGDKEAFDWEDDNYELLKGRSFSMKVTGTGLDTEYKFKLNGKSTDDDMPEPFSEQQNTADLDSLPF